MNNLRRMGIDIRIDENGAVPVDLLKHAIGVLSQGCGVSMNVMTHHDPQDPARGYVRLDVWVPQDLVPKVVENV